MCGYLDPRSCVRSAGSLNIPSPSPAARWPLAAPLPAAALSPMGGGEGGGGSWFDKLQRTKVPATKDHSLNKHCFSFNKK